MDYKESHSNLDPNESQNFHFSKFNIFSRTFFLYTLIFVNTSNKRKRKQIDPDLCSTIPIGKNENIEFNLREFDKIYEKKNIVKPNSSINLWKSLFQMFRLRVLFIIFLQIAAMIFANLNAIFVYFIIDSLTGDRNLTFMWAGLLFISKFLSMFVNHHGYDVNLVTSNCMKISLTGLIYQKILRISLFSVKKVSIGKIVNIIANDFNIFQQEIFMFYQIISTPFSWIFYFAIMANIVGWYCIIPFIGISISIPLFNKINDLVLNHRKNRNLITDERIKTINSAIDGIRLLKMYTWDQRMKNEILNLRTQEENVIFPILFADILNRILALSSYIVSAFLMFLVYYLVEDKRLTSAQVFTSLFLIGNLRLSLIFAFVNAIKIHAELNLMLKRIISILEIPEVSKRIYEKPNNPLNAIEIYNFFGSWEDIQENNPKASLNKENTYSLEEISIEIKAETLNVIVGKVGSGKSSFLQIPLSEMPITKGDVRISGKLALVEQEPIIFPGTFLDNILFGSEYDKVKISKIIYDCCLNEDIDVFPNGLETQIGEKGITLSGGQKSRLSFARAIYSNADIYLLDDPLSAVDTKVSNHLFDNAIKKSLKGKTIILATHQIHFAKSADNIIAMDSGKMIAQGSYDEMMKKHENILSYSSSTILKMPNRIQNVEKIIENEEIQLDEKDKIKEILGDVNNEATDLVQKEDINEGNVTMEVYKSYFGEYKPIWFLILTIFVFLIGNMGDIMIPRFFGEWSNGSFSSEKMFILNGVLIVVFAGIMVLQAYVFAKITIRASTKLHNKMVDKVIDSKVEFFDRNPIGRVLNRFSNDVGILDKFIIYVLFDVVHGFAFFVTQFIGIWTIQPIIIIFHFFQAFITIMYTKYVKQSISDSKALDLVSKSPIYSHLTNSLHGIVAIRLFQRETIFKKAFFKLVNQNTRAHVAFCNSSRAFGFVVELITTIFSIVTLAIVLSLNGDDPSNAGYAVLLINYLPEYIQWCFRQLVLFSIMMSSTARITSYTKLESEAPLRQFDKERRILSADWPNQGQIEFNNVVMRYRKDLEPVIKGISLKIESGQKIACIGRTGSGKSSLLQILFRMVEVDSGEIIIDGVNVKEIGLHTLRKNISIIPQTPFVFLGNIRKNLDPFKLYTDDQLWEVLELVQLKLKVNEMENKLESDIFDSSSTFSSGEKQLLCLARAILTKNKILVLDEATSNVDFHTDRLIQDHIRKSFNSTTVICIAHRLTTIADYDKIIVMSNGNIVEIGKPYELLVNQIGDNEVTNENGFFSGMVKAMGERSSHHLFKVAQNYYYNKK